MKTWITIFSAVALAGPLVAGECDKIEFTGQGGGDGFTTTHNQTFMTSAWVNCTTDTARQDGGKEDTCEFHHYAMGIVLRPEIRFISVRSATQKNIFSLIQEHANPSAVISTNFNSTIVMNHTVGAADIPVGRAGHYGLTPHLRCWDGKLSDCDDDEDDLEDKTIRACAPAWIDDKQIALPPGQQLYGGDEGFVQSDSAVASKDPQPAYDEIAGQATADHRKGDSAAARSMASSAALAVALLCSAFHVIL
ncbi:hypothetical protein GGS26DRAFT_485855 [Hypomontagnella submonticulosa]|nr:hypothetical protein GGS26DRAFT_485855 [Hypomontagnella submonticulosa]